MLLWIIIVGPTLLFALYAQMKVKGAFSKYSQVGNSSNMTGAQAAARMLQARGIGIVDSVEQARNSTNAVAIEQVRGFLGDHYDPKSRVLRLSPDVYSGRSLASVGVACHEAGHALQHAEGYGALELRNLMVPVASFGSWAAFPIIFIGAILGAANLVLVGILIFTALVVFQLITLPVEFNASTRAREGLAAAQIINGGQEMQGVKKVLDAAAMTYVAAAVSSIATLLYYVMIFTGAGRD